MEYEPTEAELNGLSGDEMAADEAQAAFYKKQAEWERQAHCHHAQEQVAWEEGEYKHMMAEVESR